MRYTASEKMEIIRLVEQSNLSVRQTLDQLGIRKSTFYNWLKRLESAGVDGLADKRPSPGIPWNKLLADEQNAIIGLALEKPELSPRELAVTYTDEQARYVSESTVYRLLKAHDLITSPAYILMQAADKFFHPTTRVNEMWQTDFTYCKIIGWGWYYLSTILDDYSRFIVAWRLCTTMSTKDVSDTLDDALEFTGLDQVNVKHKPRLLSDNGPCYISEELATYLKDNGVTHTRGRPYHPQTQGKIVRKPEQTRRAVEISANRLKKGCVVHIYPCSTSEVVVTSLLPYRRSIWCKILGVQVFIVGWVCIACCPGPESNRDNHKAEGF